MTREEKIINEAKEHYSDNIKCYDAFLHGIEWADENPKDVWRNTNEEPKHGSKVLIYCLNECGEMYCEFYHCINFNELSWKEAVDIFNIRQWAYLDNLLPKTK